MMKLITTRFRSCEIRMRVRKTIAIPVSTELFFQLTSIGSRTYETFPVLVAAVLWYLVVCSVEMAVQSRLESRFGRGFGTGPQGAQGGQGLRARTLGLLGGTK